MNLSDKKVKFLFQTGGEIALKVNILRLTHAMSRSALWPFPVLPWWFLWFYGLFSMLLSEWELLREHESLLTPKELAVFLPFGI